MPHEVLPILVRLLICFLLGAIPFAVLAMAGSGIDIRKVGSGNPGFNNVLRVSKPRAVISLVGDLGKGVLALWLVLHAWPVPLSGADGALPVGWLYGYAAVLGHCYSPFLGFSGGKGIATSCGVMLVLYPVWALVGMACYTVLRVAGFAKKWREAGMIASLSTWAVFFLLMLGFVGRQDALFAGIMTLFLVWRHKKNLQNLFAGGAAA